VLKQETQFIFSSLGGGEGREGEGGGFVSFAFCPSFFSSKVRPSGASHPYLGFDRGLIGGQGQGVG